VVHLPISIAEQPYGLATCQFTTALHVRRLIPVQPDHASLCLGVGWNQSSSYGIVYVSYVY